MAEQYKSNYTGQEIDAGIGKANSAVQPEDLGALAGKDTVDYETEVTNKPTIPAEVTESTVSGWGFTKNTGDYSKPLTGIPEEDLSEEVQNKLNSGGSGTVTVEEVTNYKNKVLNVLGDSQTEANYHKTKIYHDWLKELLGLSIVNNYGISGSTIGYNVDYNPMVTRYSSMSNDADMIIVMGGINDIGNYSGTGTSKVPLGTISDNTYNTFYGALKVLCEGLISKYPTKQIVFVTPTEVSNDWYPSGNKHRIPEGLTVQQYVNAMIEVCEMYSIPVYDAFGKLGLYAKDNSQNSIYVSDGLHLNNAGHKLLGRGLYNFILGLSRTEVSYVATSSGGDVAVTDIELNKNTSTLSAGGTEQLSVTFTPSDATDKSLTWTTSDSNVATVSNGLVTAIDAGNATITATTTNNISDSCAYTVTDLLVGKKVTVSKAIANDRSYLTALIPTDSDFAQGNTISYKLEGANVQGMIDYSINTIGAYDTASNQLSPATAVNLLAQFNATVTVTGTTMVAQTPAVTFTRAPAKPYILVPMTISGTPDFSFTVTKCEIYVNGKRKYPIKYGAFADSSKEIITIE